MKPRAAAGQDRRREGKMASLTRSIKRGMRFAGMNKQQRALWHAEHGGKTAPKYQQLRQIAAKVKA